MTLIVLACIGSGLAGVILGWAFGVMFVTRNFARPSQSDSGE